MRGQRVWRSAAADSTSMTSSCFREDDEPRLPVDWLRASGAFNARFELTPDVVREFQAGLEVLIEPYATRNEADTADGAASVRILGYFMPEASAP